MNIKSVCKMNYIYISNRTRENLKLSKLPSTQILQSYKNIKSKKKRETKDGGYFCLIKLKMKL